MAVNKSSVLSMLDLIAEVEQHKDVLIEMVESFFENRKTQKRELVPVTKTQLSNLLRLASETTSTKEVLAFIRYQIGRESEKKQDKWRWRKDEFGEQLIRVLEQEVLRLHNEKKVQIRLMRLFLGYMRRQAIYLGPAVEEGENK